jgi:hypothetical protein
MMQPVQMQSMPVQAAPVQYITVPQPEPQYFQSMPAPAQMQMPQFSIGPDGVARPAQPQQAPPQPNMQWPPRPGMYAEYGDNDLSGEHF